MSISRRNESFRIEGAKKPAERAVALLQTLYDRARKPIPAEEFQLALMEASRTPRDGRPREAPAARRTEELVLRTRRADLQAARRTRTCYLRNILEPRHHLRHRPGGHGQDLPGGGLRASTRSSAAAVQRIILTRPAVEAGERLGFLPGDLTQKVDPYLRPLYDALYDLMGFDRVTKAFEKGTIEIAPLAFMRGRTLNHAFVILDEAQNTTPEQMKMFLTRIGFGSKCVVTGDVSQIDLPRGTDSGLVEAERVLRRVRGIAMTRFTSADVVRHPLVARIVEAYEAADRSSKE